MKILHVIPSYAPAFHYGGTIVSSEGLCKALVTEGHEVTVCTTNLNGKEVMPFPSDVAVERGGVKVWYFPVENICRRLSERLYFSTEMKSWLKANISHYDVIHLHSVYLWPTYIAARFARRAGVPYIISPRGMLVRQLIQKKSSLIKRLWIYLIEKRNLKNAHLVHFTSQREYADAKELGLIFGAHFIEANGVDLPKLTSSQTNVNEAQYLLYLGRINWKKGLNKLISAFAASNVNSQLKLRIAGNDDEGYQSALEELAEQKGVSDSIEFIGFVEGEQKASLIENAMCLALCSENENFGNVVLEALSYETPVIATKGVGASSILSEHQAGIVVDNSVNEIAKAIKQTVSQTEKMKQMGRNGRLAMEKSYSWQSIAQNFVKHYQQIINDK